jgi:hypothetical protein
VAKRKYPSELSTRHVRVNVGDYFLLTELSNKLGITMGEALHLAITSQSRREPKVSPAQIAMPVFPVLSESPSVVKGSEQAALSIKPKGGVLDE